MPNPKHEKVVALDTPFRKAEDGSQPPAFGAAPAMVPFPRWQKACDRVSAALLGGETRLVVYGPAGTGKTLLLDQVARVLRAAGWTVVLRLADPAPARGHSAPAAVLVDEADRLSRAELAQLLAGTPGPLVLVGLEPLQALVSGATQIALSALGREEARDYIAHWLALTGRTPANLDAAAMRQIVALAGGIPRTISTLLGAACWLAESTGETVATVRHVEEAAALRSSFAGSEADEDASIAAVPPIERRNVPVLLPIAAGMLLLGAAGFVAARYLPDETGQLVATGRDAATQVADLVRARLGELPKAADPIPRAVSQPISAPAVAPAVASMAAIPPQAPAPPPEAPAAATSVAAAVPELPAPAAVVATPAAPDQPIPDAQPAVETVPEPRPAVTGESAAEPAAQPEPPAASTQAATKPDDTPRPVVPEPPPAEPTKPTVVATAAPLEVRPTLPAETLLLLVRRGRDMLALGDVSAARLLFGRAAEAGDADAMVAMGRTYEAAALAGVGPLLAPSPAEANRWYRRAADAGNQEAADLLRQPR